MHFEGLNLFIKSVENESAAIKAEISRATQEAGLRMEKEAVSRVPVDTGYLKRSIRCSKVERLTVSIDVFASYAKWVEEGTRRQQAQPYLKPALKQEGPRYFKIVKAIVKGGIR